MKTIFIFIFLLSFKFFGQDVSEINKTLNISDSLTSDKEIRIYKDYSITNGVEIFRMYCDEESVWNANLYSYNKTLKSATNIEQINLKKIDINMIWLNLLISDIENLPNLKEIKYKLKLSKIELIDGEYEIIEHQKRILDGESYKIFFKDGKINNNFEFACPESYLKYYPNVDEIISYNKILSIIKKEGFVVTEVLKK